MNLDLHYGKELAEMRAKYRKHPMKTIDLPCPDWLKPSDAYFSIYERKDALLDRGQLCYACVVQANDILFRRRPAYDCPADLLYSTDPMVCDNPWILHKTAQQLFSYKNQPLETVPEQWRDIARSITDEHDPSAFSFTLTAADGSTVAFHFIANMIYRQLLPGKVLRGHFLPVFALPDEFDDTVLILPPKYWSGKFKSAWKQGRT